ncbi:membrane protein insertion efficiency factor YidD [Patescibacteria group bacterium]
MFKNNFLKTIKLYQLFVSPLIVHSCRFWPSCSEYSYQAIEKHGALRGFFLSLKRLFKCYPWNKGGIDIP